MKKTSSKTALHPVIAQELHDRLAELESELRAYPARSKTDRTLKRLSDIEEATLGSNKVIQFSIGSKVYATGHTDTTYAGSNHARGVRQIRFYVEGKEVLVIEGDFEDQQFGSNFRFKNINLHTPGAWEADLVNVTEQLREHAAKRKAAFKKKRDAIHARR